MTSSPMMDPGRTSRQTAQAARFSLIVDAADYFVAARAAMLKAKHSILLIGWDFDARIALRGSQDEGGQDDGGQDEGGQDEGPEILGDFILWLADRTPALEIRLLRWDIGALKTLLRGKTLLWVMRWKRHPRITLRLDSAHALGASHHQKILVIDDSMAFCGGIDMTENRWDTRAHRDHEPSRKTPSGKDHGPWHDTTSAFDGAAARALGDLARDRWAAATGEVLPPCPDRHDSWPDTLKPDFRDIRPALLRTVPAHGDDPGCHEVEAAYLALIASARRVIYAESQYFASRRIGRAIARRLTEADGPEVVIVTPRHAEGWLEPLVMDTARARLAEALSRIDHHKRFRIYHPVTAGEADIYVHSKTMIVDDSCLRVGSSNLNNRSMRMDTECDVVLTASHDHDRARITALRDDLVAEHLGVAPQDVAAAMRQTGSLIATIESLRGAGRSLVPYTLPETSDAEDWLADNEILDPNGPDAVFEPFTKRGLFKGWGHLRRKIHKTR